MIKKKLMKVSSDGSVNFFYETFNYKDITQFIVNTNDERNFYLNAKKFKIPSTDPKYSLSFKKKYLF
jgi:hypothetical protein